MSTSNINKRIIIKLLGNEQNKLNFKKTLYNLEDLKKEYYLKKLKETIKYEFEHNKNTQNLSKSQENLGNIKKLNNGFNNKLNFNKENEIGNENEKKYNSLEEMKKLNNNDENEDNNNSKKKIEKLNNNYDITSFNPIKLNKDDMIEKGNILNNNINKIHNNEKNNFLQNIKTLNKEIENNNLSQTLFLKEEMKKIYNSISNDTKKNKIRIKYYKSYKNIIQNKNNQKNPNKRKNLQKFSFNINYRNKKANFASFNSSFISNDNLYKNKYTSYLNKEKIYNNLQNKNKSVNDNNKKTHIKNNSVEYINKYQILKKMKSFNYNNNLYIYGEGYFNKYPLNNKIM